MLHLVTGGSGFLGNLIALRLLERGERVRVVDIWKDTKQPNDIEFVNCDIRDQNGIASAMQGVDVVHHNVALVPLTKSGKKFREVNVVGSEIAAQEAVKAGVKGFIHMSSSAIYGVPRELPITETTPTTPVEIYGRGKLAGERIVRKTLQEAGMPLVIIRPRTILGHGRLGIFQILFEWIRENRNVYVVGSGNVGFQFVHAHDLMDFYMLALDSEQAGAYNVGSDRFGTLREALETLVQHARSTSRVRSLPVLPTVQSLRLLDWLNLSPLAPWHYLTYHEAFYFDVKPLLQMGWKPQYSNDEMLAESFDWFLSHRHDGDTEGAQSPHRKSVKELALRVLKMFS